MLCLCARQLIKVDSKKCPLLTVLLLIYNSFNEAKILHIYIFGHDLIKRVHTEVIKYYNVSHIMLDYFNKERLYIIFTLSSYF